MASCQQRGDKFQFRIVAKNVLPKPVYLTFDDKQEGQRYVAKLEALIKQGIVPPELIESNFEFVFVEDVIKSYKDKVAITEDDHDLLEVQMARIGRTRLAEVNYDWCETWVADMKQVRHLAPSTIRHHVGTLARCFDWGSNRGIPELAVNPLRMLPRGYSAYNAGDAKALEAQGKEAKEDVWRDRRLETHEETAVRAILNGEKPAGRERAFTLRWQGALECVFELALETAMRMREIYTLDLYQLDFDQRTIFLEKTKNGHKRQVPMSSVVVKALQKYIQQVKDGARNMAGFDLEERLFPFWDGDLDKKKLKAISNRMSRQWAGVFSAAGASGFRFHDLRHEATSRFFEKTKLSDGEIMKITGHSSAEMLLRYANLRGSNLADKLW